MANMPDNISKNKKMMKIWEERISGILTNYENLIRLVCGNFQSNKPWKAHEKKWEKFSLKLRGNQEYPYYCVHH